MTFTDEDVLAEHYWQHVGSCVYHSEEILLMK